jgi:hypothetical protein
VLFTLLGLLLVIALISSMWLPGRTVAPKAETLSERLEK